MAINDLRLQIANIVTNVSTELSNLLINLQQEELWPISQKSYGCENLSHGITFSFIVIYQISRSSNLNIMRKNVNSIHGQYVLRIYKNSVNSGLISGGCE